MEITESKPRDAFLDCAKAVGIILVIAGHQAQNSTADFDNLLLFRVIYSFHMPFFMFISGMVASLWLEKFLASATVAEAGVRTARDVGSKVLRLLVPFLVWAAVAFARGAAPASDIGAWYRMLIVSPDYGLWFLPALFECTLFFYVAAFLVYITPRIRRGLMLPVACLVSLVLTTVLPSAYGGWWAKSLYPYFIIGLMFYFFSHGRTPAWLPWVCSAAFVVSVPFWFRTEHLALANTLPLGHAIDALYRLFVALTACFAVSGFVRWLAQSLRGRALGVITLVGQRSLDIYAIHFALIAVWPPLAGTLAASMGVSSAIRLSRWTSLIFFGEKGTKSKTTLAPSNHEDPAFAARGGVAGSGRL